MGEGGKCVCRHVDFFFWGFGRVLGRGGVGYVLEVGGESVSWIVG